MSYYTVIFTCFILTQFQEIVNLHASGTHAKMFFKAVHLFSLDFLDGKNLALYFFKKPWSCFL